MKMERRNPRGVPSRSARAIGAVALPAAIIALVPALVSGPATASAAPAQAGSRPAHPAQAWAPDSPNLPRVAADGSDTADLVSISVLGSDEAWAAGSASADAGATWDPLTEHWDGTQWSQVAVPMPKTTSTTQVYNVADLAADDTWIVGTYSKSDGLRNSYTLTSHWDGTRWKRVPSPNPGGLGDNGAGLTGVSGDSSADVWAVGMSSVNSRTPAMAGLAVHWDGTSWQKVRVPHPGSVYNNLQNVSVLSPTDAWAVGCYGDDPNEGCMTPLVIHWDGTHWTRVRVPKGGAFAGMLISPEAVTAVSPTDLWVTGFSTATSGGAYSDFAMHWDGSKWSYSQTPNPGLTNMLTGAAAVSSDAAWSSGFSVNSSFQFSNVMLKWDGTSWTEAKTPMLKGATGAIGNYVAADSATDAWEIGQYLMADGSAPPMALHWDGTKWRRTAITVTTY